MLKKISLVTLCSLIGVVFLFSGYTKLYPIEPFEFTFVDVGFFSWEAAPFAARILIGFEFLIGILFLINLNLQKFAYKLAALFLLFFASYLIVLILIKGNEGNCGCFGSTIEMTPLQAIVKNILMLIVVFVLHKLHAGWELKTKKLSVLIFISSMSLPFILNPVELNYSEAYLNKPTENYQLALDSLYVNATHTIPPRSLSEGKHVIAFMSLTCSHCKIAAQKMGIIHQRNPMISFYFVFNGYDKNINPFIKETETKGVPYCLLPRKAFTYLAGTTWPAIYLIDNSVVEHRIDYLNMNQAEIEKWLEK